MKSIRYISHNENETKKLAVQIASKLNIGDIIVLTGELGSGKTKFTEGFLSYFNLDKEISSPTFTMPDLDLLDIANPSSFSVV